MKEVHHFLDGYFGNSNYVISDIPAAGSARRYYRITNSSNTYILCQSEDVKENESFIYFSEKFDTVSLPKVLEYNPAKTILLQTDVGHDSLLDTLQSDGETTGVLQLYKDSIAQLVRFQEHTFTLEDKKHLLSHTYFDKDAFVQDLNYFTTHFLDQLCIPYNQKKWQQECNQIAQQISQSQSVGWMYRDFQSRNIQVKNNEVHLIDFQGCMQGPIQYDMASLLWQAKANLSEEWKTILFDYYFEQVKKSNSFSIQKVGFYKEYEQIVLLRLLQVLGAYGNRGLREGKQHFLNSIPFGIDNLNKYTKAYGISNEFEELKTIVQHISSNEFLLKIKNIIQ